MEDPNPKTTGPGFARLRAAKIELESGVLEDEAQTAQRSLRLLDHHEKPFVTLKSALTLDGQLALPETRKSKKPAWITSEESRAEVHRMRHASDALLTGIGTILADDPLLTDRSGLPPPAPSSASSSTPNCASRRSPASCKPPTTTCWSSPARRSTLQKRASCKTPASN